MRNLNFALLLALVCLGSGCIKINKSSNIEVNTFTSSDHLFVELEQLEALSKTKRVEFINRVVAKHGDGLISFKNIEQGAESIERLA